MESASQREESVCLAAVCLIVLHAGECGTSMATQWAIRAELRARFEDKAWLDVFTKQDLLQDVQQSAAAASRGGGDPSSLAGARSPPGPLHARGSSEGQDATQSSNGDASVLRQQHQQPVMGSREGEGTQQASTAAHEAASTSSKQETIGVGSEGASASGRSFSWGDRTEGGLQTALEVAHALPGAVWVSSVTDDGMADLKAAVLQMLQRQTSAPMV